MSNSHRTTSEQSSGVLPSVDRRRVLQGIGTLTVGSAISGTATASDRGAADASADRAMNEGRGDGLPIGIQFWTLRDLEEPVTETIHRVSDAGYDGIEPYTLGDEEPSEIATAIDETGIDPASAHVGLDALENDFQETVDTWTSAGFDTFVVPSTDESFWQSREGVEEIATRMNDVADRLEERGLQLVYHNHDQEFVELETMTAYECWLRETNDNVRLQIDAGWVLAAGYDPVALAVRTADRVESLHVKDMTVEEPGEEYDFASIGTGDLNLEALVSIAVHTLDDPYLIFENDEPGETEEEILVEMHRGLEVISAIQDRVLGQRISSEL